MCGEGLGLKSYVGAAREAMGAKSYVGATGEAMGKTLGSPFLTLSGDFWVSD